MTSKADWLFRVAYPVAVLTLVLLAPSSARADFFDDLRRTFQSDIPHFFQDDIPCTFGGRPTSGTKTSCKSSDHPAKSVTDKDQRAAPSDKPNKDQTNKEPDLPAKAATDKDHPATVPSDKTD
jgi:hypothetical protein